jgi:hypothetical protein
MLLNNPTRTDKMPRPTVWEVKNRLTIKNLPGKYSFETYGISDKKLYYPSEMRIAEIVSIPGIPSYVRFSIC